MTSDEPCGSVAEGSVADLISDDAAARLREAGWSTRRSAPLAKLTDFLAREGWVVNPDAALTLRGLYRLTIKNGTRTEFDFDPDAALSTLNPGSARLIRRFFNEGTCPIGSGRDMCLLIGESSRCLLIDDQWLGYSSFQT